MKRKISLLLGLLLACGCLWAQIVPDYGFRHADTAILNNPLVMALQGGHVPVMFHDSTAKAIAERRPERALRMLLQWRDALRQAGDTTSMDYKVVTCDLGLTLLHFGCYHDCLQLLSGAMDAVKGDDPIHKSILQKLAVVNSIASGTVAPPTIGVFTGRANESVGANISLGADLSKDMNLIVSQDSIHYFESVMMLRQQRNVIQWISAQGSNPSLPSLIDWISHSIQLGEYHLLRLKGIEIPADSIARWRVSYRNVPYEGGGYYMVPLYMAELMIQLKRYDVAQDIINEVRRDVFRDIVKPTSNLYMGLPQTLANIMLLEEYLATKRGAPRDVNASYQRGVQDWFRAKAMVERKCGGIHLNWRYQMEHLLAIKYLIDAYLHPQLHDYAAALQATALFFEGYEDQYRWSQGEDTQLWLASQSLPMVESALSLIVSLKKQPQLSDIERGKIDEILWQVDAFKGRLLGMQLRASLMIHAPDAVSKDAARLRAIREELAVMRAKRFAGASFPAAIAQHEMMLQAQEKELLMKGETHALPLDGRHHGVATLQKMLHADEAMLYFVELNGQIFRLCIEREQWKAELLQQPGWVAGHAVARSQFKDAIASLSKPFQSPKDYAQSAQSLCALLWPWTRAEDAPRKVSVFPDGHLWALAVDGLVYPGTAADDFQAMDYLIRHHQISSWPNFQMWLSSRLDGAPAAQGGALWVAPSFKAPIAHCDSTATTRYPALQALSDAVEGFSKRYEGRFLLDDAANEAKVKANFAHASLLSLSSHVVVNEEDPLTSYIALNSACGDSVPEDGRLHAYEILGGASPAELVMLWGCSTGKGLHSPGEGLLSIGRAFLASGARSVLMSQWDMEEAPTAKIMEDYIAGLANGLDKAEALRQAKLHWIDAAGPLAAEPRRWAGWSLVGDTRPLVTPLQARRSQAWAWAGAGMLAFGAFAMILWVRRRRR